jgi:hypothetical protein
VAGKWSRRGVVNNADFFYSPTGVETAAEIYDFCQEDIMSYVRTCLESSSYAKLRSTPKFAERKFQSMLSSLGGTY